MQPRRVIPIALLGLVGVPLGCAGDNGEASETSTSTQAPADDGGTTGDEMEGSLADLCEAAPPVPVGRTLGTLRGAGSDLGGACGNGGPDVFALIDVPRRSDVEVTAIGAAFQAWVGVLPSACVGDWSDRSLLCTPGGPGTVLDVAAGTELIVAVGIDPDDPARELIPTDATDPLDFALDVRLRNVFAPGDACGTSTGRCATGTVCLQDTSGTPVCTVIPGDTCATAVEFPVAPGVQTLSIERTGNHTDAHQHSCGGARRPERVVALRLADVAEAAELEVRTAEADVELALRGPGCLLADEIACASEDGPTARVPAIGDALRGAEVVFLFVEMTDGVAIGEGGWAPASGAPAAAPIEIEVELTNPAED